MQRSERKDEMVEYELFSMHINLITLWSEPGNLYQSSLWLRPMLKLVFLVNEIFELGLLENRNVLDT